jgi:hypothetical protein
MSVPEYRIFTALNLIEIYLFTLAFIEIIKVLAVRYG